MAILAQTYDSSPNSHEERFTGTFIETLREQFRVISGRIEEWARRTVPGAAKFTCVYQDVAANGPEKIWGADAGFCVDVHVSGVIKFRRAVIVQIKKAEPPNGNTWRIEPRQCAQILKRSPFSVYLLHGGYNTGIGVRIIPALTISHLLAGGDKKVHLTSKAIAATRLFRNFFTYDLLGDWWGDQDGPVVELVKGGAEEFPVRWLFTVTLQAGSFPELG